MSVALSVIVVSWNVRELLRACLDDLYRSAAASGATFEVIVVDNASSDGSAALVRAAFPHALCLEAGSNLGFARANNLALRQARGEYVLLLNPDVRLGEEVVPELLRIMRSEPGVAALGCRLRNADGSLQRWTAGRLPTLGAVACHYLFVNELFGWLGVAHSVYLTRDLRTRREVGWLCGACLLLRRAAIPQPMFDPGFFLYGEDMDLCRRIAARGGRIVYAPEVCVTHLGGASMRQRGGSPDLAPLLGMRTVYRRGASRAGLLLFDLVTLAGFAGRWWLHLLAARLTGREAPLRRAEACGALARAALHIAWRGAAP